MVYEKLQDAEEAIKKFNNVCLDGKPLVIKMEDTKSHITTLSSGISVTEPQDKPGDGQAVRKPYSHSTAPVPSAGRNRLKSSIVKSGLYADRMDTD